MKGRGVPQDEGGDVGRLPSVAARGRLLALTVGAASLVGGCQGLELADGPALDGLRRSYEQPDGQLNQEEIERVVETARATYQAVLEFRGLDFVIDTIEKVSSVVQEYAASENGDPLQIDVASETERVCAGHDGDEPNDPSNGTLDFTLNIENSIVRPVVWGGFSGCRAQTSDGRPVVLDTSLAVLLQGRLTLRHLDLQKFIVRIAGDARVSDEPLDLDLDFRVLEDRSIEIRVPSGTGDVVFGFGLDGQRAAVRAQNQSFCCDFSQRRCIEVESADCDAEQVGDTELTW